MWSIRIHQGVWLNCEGVIATNPEFEMPTYIETFVTHELSMLNVQRKSLVVFPGLTIKFKKNL